mmetsp:Transcript_9413/g.19526  ORF Transcript_9413/g.19526 Transcript_9413/m.19526 type:complete len:283 (+) Transcript_9413:56-904(+)
MMDWQTILFEYVCPVGGCFLASSVFAAPIHDLNQALARGSLGSLNTTPWAVMTGNCLGWCAYSYCTNDPFVLASNLPGLILSLWLNIGACKLQYLGQIRNIQSFQDCQDDEEPETAHRKPIFVQRLSTAPQDEILFGILGLWAVVLTSVRWMNSLMEQQLYNVWEPQSVIGLLVNINLVFFYGAPLQTMKLVLETRSSDSIHTPTVSRNVVNAIFWMSYGLAREDPIIYGPNGVGLLLGLAQVALCAVYPKQSSRTPESTAVEETVDFQSGDGTILTLRNIY